MQPVLSLKRHHPVDAETSTNTNTSHHRRRQQALAQLDWLGLPLALMLLVVVWQAAVSIFDYETFILPAPALVLERFVTTASSGLLWEHTAATMQSAVGGFALALVLSVVFGYILAHIRWLERATAPVLAASVTMPIIALAPLIMLWFGVGMTARILIAALTAFFPIIMNTIIALRSVPTELREMAMISGANRWQVLSFVELPLALPVFFTGVRIGLSRATIGAVVGEFVAGRYGLGALINIARNLFDTPLIFVALLTLAAMALSFYMLAYLLERTLIRWEA
jgi:NitT/TauT family transport system permease protein